MKTITAAIIIFFACLNISAAAAAQEQLKEGDIIFHASLSSQSKAIQLATNSPYSHCGIIFKENGRFMVYEAVQPVKFTPLNDWIKRGKDGKYIVKRLKNADNAINPKAIEKMKAEGLKFKGKSYDLAFKWSDERIYCSELVWKIYKRALNVELGKPQKLKEMDLSSDEVKTKAKERYGASLPLNEDVITPAALFDSPLLETVIRN